MKQNNMLAMILAGGRGSRLHELTNKVAKPAVSYGGKYKIIDFPISNCANSGIEIEEYTPLQIKQALTGYGRADKKQVQLMVKTILNLKEVPKPDDTADALAAAICHGHSTSGRRMMNQLMKGGVR